jgi:arginyl-tRNA synthetase
MREYLKQLIRKAVKVEAQKYGYKDARIDFSLEPPPRPELGDYATNAALRLASEAGVEAVKVADGIRSSLIGIEGVFDDISIAGGGFLNFILSQKFVASLFQTFNPKRISKRQDGTILIEYSSPNIGKPLSIAHIRSTIIGDSLMRIYRALGWRVITDNHLGDWGLQAGILIAAYKLWAQKPIAKMSMEELLELYVKFNSEMKVAKELEDRARMETLLLQKEDRQTIAIWKQIQKKSIKEFKRIYKILGVKFDYILGESAYRKNFPKVILDAKRAGVAQESQGAVVIPFESNEPPLIIQKQDGGYLYATFDLATIRYRIERWKPKLMLYVISNEQTQYLNQVFRAAEKLGWLSPGQAIHVKFGLLRGEDLKRLSTRQGKTILLEDVIEEVVLRARQIVEEKNPGLSEKEKERISRMVGIGALKYNDLSQNRNTDIIFDWNRMLDFQGNSAPYIQYTHARLKSILRKTQMPKSKFQKVNLGALVEPEEIALMKKVLQFSEAVEDAAREYAPNLVANYLWGLSNLANTLYEKYPVLKAEKGVREARLFLINRIADVLKEGLGLLGIEAPERV